MARGTRVANMARGTRVANMARGTRAAKQARRGQAANRTRRGKPTTFARAVTSATPANPGGQAARLAGALQALAKGLPNPWDESTDYFHGFAAALPAGARLDAAAFRQALGVGARYQLALSPADDVLAGLGDAADDWGEDIAGGFRQLASVMRATLSDRSIVHARGKGVIRVRVWLCGRTEDGAVVGLRSISTET